MNELKYIPGDLVMVKKAAIKGVAGRAKEFLIKHT